MLLGPALTKLPAANAAFLTGHSFFPSLISAPFQAGLDIAFDFAIVACLVAAVASLLRGKRYVHDETAVEATADVESAADVAAEAGPAPAVVPATARVAIAEEIQESAQRLAGSPEPALRTFKER
jgi:hypothetical protein